MSTAAGHFLFFSFSHRPVLPAGYNHLENSNGSSPLALPILWIRIQSLKHIKSLTKVKADALRIMTDKTTVSVLLDSVYLCCIVELSHFVAVVRY